MSSITVAPTASNASRRGVEASKLQSDIAIVGNSIKGTSKKISEDPGWEPDTWSLEESTGNFLVLDLKASEGETIKTKVQGGVHDEFVTVDDGFCIYRLTDTSSQKIVVQGEIGGKQSKNITYDLTKLTLET